MRRQIRPWSCCGRFRLVAQGVAALVGMALSLMLMASPPASTQRDEALTAARELSGGAALVSTSGGDVLVATSTVPIPEGLRPDKAFSLAAAAALIEARAEAALFLGGTYSGSRESGSDSKTSSDGTSRRESWIRTHASSLARVKLTAGESLEIGRVDGGVRALVAWGLAGAGRIDALVSEQFVGAQADAALAATQVPALDLRWVTDVEGKEGLLVTMSIHPDAPLRPCTLAQATGAGPPCACRLCRDKALNSKLQAAVAAWSEDGDVGVARNLERVAQRTTMRAKDGTESLTQVTVRSQGSRTSTAVQAVIPPDFFAKSIRQVRHSDSRSVCVAYVPIEATPAKSEP